MPKRHDPARTRPKRSRPAVTQSRLVLIGLAIVVLAAAALLAVFAVGGPLADAWHPVVTVDGVSVNRAELRARLELDAALLEARQATLRNAAVNGQLPSAEFDRLQGELAADASDPVRTAIDGLVADAVIRAAAQDAGLAAPVDVDAELAAAAAADLDRRLEAITIALTTGTHEQSDTGWPAPPPDDADAPTLLAARQAALDRAAAELAGGTDPASIAEALAAAGWRASVADRWIGPSGPVTGLPDGLVRRARESAEPLPATLVPVLDPVGGTDGVGRVVALTGPTPSPTAVDGIDRGTLERWALARADERALRDWLATGWRTESQPLARVRELVIGSADLTGTDADYRSFAHLVVGQLPASVTGGVGADDVAARLAAELGALDRPAREQRFAELVALANATPSDDPLAASGELDYYPRDQLLPELADRAFADGVADGDVMGPVATRAGPELFLVRGRFRGVLDERASAALVEARTTSDVLAMARRVAPPGEWLRAEGALWRAVAEAAGSEPLRIAYGSAPGLGPSDPVVLDGELLVVWVDEVARTLAPPDVLDRLLVRGYDAWLAGRLDAAVIEPDPEPLPGIVIESPTPAMSAAPTMITMPTPPVPSVPSVP